MTTARRIHLWDDGTYTDTNGHWVAVRIEQFDKMQADIKELNAAGVLLERNWLRAEKRIDALEEALAQIEISTSTHGGDSFPEEARDAANKIARDALGDK